MEKTKLEFAGVKDGGRDMSQGMQAASRRQKSDLNCFSHGAFRGNTALQTP
jgi:hypothetical protein